MEPTKYAAKLPTRIALRKTASRIWAASPGHLPSAIVVRSAAAAVAAGAVTVGVGVAVLVASLSAHPAALLAIAFVTTFALSTLPLLALRAVA
jgi:hypothetical protein